MNYWNMALLFSFDEPGPGDNPGHLNFLDIKERVQEMSPSRKNWMRTEDVPDPDEESQDNPPEEDPVDAPE